MPATPLVTLTATLDDLTGAPAGSIAAAAKLRIALCGFGPYLPKIIGTAMIAKAGPFGFLSTGNPLSLALWANDQIFPANTFYSIEILDGEDNVIQCGAYQFLAGGSALNIDLSNATQIVPPYGLPISFLRVIPCTGAVPGTQYVAAGAEIVIAVFYNGVLLTPTTDYTVAQINISLNFTTQVQNGIPDQISALVV